MYNSWLLFLMGSLVLIDSNGRLMKRTPENYGASTSITLFTTAYSSSNFFQIAFILSMDLKNLKD